MFWWLKVLLKLCENVTALFGHKDFPALFLLSWYSLFYKLDLELCFLKMRKKGQETKILRIRQGSLKAQNNLIFIH